MKWTKTPIKERNLIISEITTTRVHLVDWRTGKICYPIVNKDDYFVCAPFGNNLAVNQVIAKTEDELIELIHEGFSVWIKVNGKPNLRRYNLFVDGQQVTFKDQKFV